MCILNILQVFRLGKTSIFHSIRMMVSQQTLDIKYNTGPAGKQKNTNFIWKIKSVHVTKIMWRKVEGIVVIWTSKGKMETEAELHDDVEISYLTVHLSL